MELVGQCPPRFFHTVIIRFSWRAYLHVILVISGNRNKISQTVWIKWQTSISHKSGVWEIQNQDAGRFGVYRIWCIPLWSWRCPPCCVLTWHREKEQPLWSLLSALIPSWGPRHLSFSKSNYLTPNNKKIKALPPTQSFWRLRLKHVNFEGHNL